ncbi:MAG TPA: hypothetical protein VIQ99_01050, partial [Gammaproteobacteria bacterium]
MAISIACAALAAVRAAHAQLTGPRPISEEQEKAALGLPEWRQALGPLDGTWEGTVAVVDATDKTPPGFWQPGNRPE